MDRYKDLINVGTDKPSEEFIKKDEEGREMFLYSCSYQRGDSDWCFYIWAYSFDDAEDRVTAMNESGIVLDGQVYAVIPPE